MAKSYMVLAFFKPLQRLSKGQIQKENYIEIEKKVHSLISGEGGQK